MGGDEFCVLLAAPTARPTSSAARQLGAVRVGRGLHGHAPRRAPSRCPARRRTVSDALAIADRRMYAHKRGDRMSASNQSKDVLLRAVHERSPNLGAHGGEVAELAERTAPALGLDIDMVRAVRQGAELHDIGKLAVPDAILNKPGPLDDAEWAFMRRHTLVGERILAAAPALADVAQLVRASHERWDGSGYPDGLAGEQIPLGSRVIAVCDAWDAMVTDRPYRRAMSRARRARRARALRRHPVRPGGRRGVPRRARPRRGGTCRRWPDPEILARVESDPGPRQARSARGAPGRVRHRGPAAAAVRMGGDLGRLVGVHGRARGLRLRRRRRVRGRRRRAGAAAPGGVHRAGHEPARRPQLAPRRDGAGDARALRRASR